MIQFMVVEYLYFNQISVAIKKEKSKKGRRLVLGGQSNGQS